MRQGLIRGLGLSKNQLSDIGTLASICNTHDNITMKLNWDFLNSRPQNELQDFLYYDENQLVGYLALYIFNNKEAEVSAMVHPKYRNQGIFSILLEQAIQEVKQRKIYELLFFTDTNSNSGISALEHLQSTYEFSEYLMKWNNNLPQDMRDQLKVRVMKEDDVQDVINIDSQCFNLSKLDAEKMSQVQLNSPTNLRFIAELNGTIVGKINVQLNNSPAYIFGFAVLPEYQGKGYGLEILQKTIVHLDNLSRNDIVLEVAVKNLNALKLYEKVGFNKVTGYDYFRIKLAEKNS
ncbi:GNAT family N-acetyltransferase [Lottiidibacillus patelloidae]|uniref:GNAT family N-acetyltransferase n=1 Tax=Lottiidibacillus patelloidae TaxID=2670334 RepID=UPI0013035F87|nr:GNAT family N-acetyltransferase [Lottiidibacillus patelloidae]